MCCTLTHVTIHPLFQFLSLYRMASNAGNAGKSLAQRAWHAFSERFLIMANHWPYVDKLSERVKRPGEKYVCQTRKHKRIHHGAQYLPVFETSRS